MTNKQKVFMASAGAIIVIAILIYGGTSLYSKMNQVKDLNEQVAQVTDDELQDEISGPSELEDGDSDDQQLEGQSPEATDQPRQEPNGEQAAGGSGAGVSTEVEEAAAASAPPATVSPSAPGGDTPAATPKPIGKEERKADIDGKITMEMEKLRASCTATSSNLVKQIVQALSNDETSVESIQNEYLSSIIAAEADCDKQFNQVVDNAKERYESEGIDEQAMPNWQADYDSAKEQARADAFVAIAGALD